MVKLINNPVRTTIQVAIGIIANAEGKLLVAKRPKHWLGGGLWEFPGGKLEANENSEAALRRELLEEIGIVVGECSPLIHITYDYPERTVVFHAWNVHSFSGQAAGLEGQEIRWQHPSALNQLKMLPANRAIVVAMQLPDKYLITPECTNEKIFLKELKQVLIAHRIKLVQLRSKQLTASEYLSLAKAALSICQDNEAKLMLNTNELAILNDIDADGIHLRSEQLHKLVARPLAKDKWVCCSCHNREEIQKAEAIDSDFVVISPVNSSPNKSVSLGWESFAELVESANIPAYALGGMKKMDLPLAKKLGAQGISGITEFWVRV
jgi:8-oxo-dGTP diphosphatase